MMQPPRFLQRQRGYLLAEAQHFILQPAELHVFGRGKAAGMFLLDQLDAASVLRVRPFGLLAVGLDRLARAATAP
jgi:hypothetical protein